MAVVNHCVRLSFQALTSTTSSLQLGAADGCVPWLRPHPRGRLLSVWRDATARQVTLLTNTGALRAVTASRGVGSVVLVRLDPSGAAVDGVQHLPLVPRDYRTGVMPSRNTAQPLPELPAGCKFVRSTKTRVCCCARTMLLSWTCRHGSSPQHTHTHTHTHTQAKRFLTPPRRENTDNSELLLVTDTWAN